METHHPSKILMTADSFGGVWTYALELARALENTQIALATTGEPLSQEQRETAAAISNLTIYESNYKPEWQDVEGSDLKKAGEWLLQLKDEVQPDLIHLNGMIHASLPWGKPVVVVVHSCVLTWWRAVRHEDAPKQWNNYKELVTKGLQAADMVVTSTQALMHEATEAYGPFKKSAVVYSWLASS